MFIEYTKKSNGEKVLINISFIETITDEGGHTRIMLKDAMNYLVVEPFEYFREKLV